MARLNPHFDKFSGPSVFPEVEKKVLQAKQQKRNRPFIDLSVGDVTKPLLPSLLSALWPPGALPPWRPAVLRSPAAPPPDP